MIRTSDDMPTLAFMAYSAAVNQAGTLLDWLFSGNFEKFPNLKIALSEGSIGWIPYFLERAEQVVDKQRFWASRFDINMNASTSAARKWVRPSSTWRPIFGDCSPTTSSAPSSRIGRCPAVGHHR